MGSTGVTAAPTVDYTYGTSVSSNNNGRLVSVSNGFASDTFTYGTLGQVTAVAKVINSTTYNLGYAYNDAGQLTSITYPSNRVVTQTMDAIGRLEKVTSSSVDYLTVTDFTAAGAVHTATLGNGVEATFEFNDRLQLESLSYVKNTTKLLELAYSYTTTSEGNNGQIRRIEDSSSVTGASGRTVDYTYDAWARLKTAVTAGSTQFPQWGLSWTYDRYGNRKEQDVTHGTGPSNEVTINTANNRITDTGYSYDANGNLLANGTMTLAYDSENRVVSDTGFENQTSFSYDGAGLRVRKQFQDLGGTRTVTYVYSGTQVLAEYNTLTPESGSPTTTLTEYIYAGGQKLATITGGTAKYHLNDHLSARVTTDSSGGNAVEQGHFPFGEEWYAGSGASKFKFTTYERDTSQSDYAVFRNYQFLNGRFDRPDPIAGDSTDPQSLNRYAYVRNDPINMIDPLGLVGVSCTRNGVPTICVTGTGSVNEILGGLFGGGGGGDLIEVIYDLDRQLGDGGGQTPCTLTINVTGSLSDLSQNQIRDIFNQAGVNVSFVRGQAATAHLLLNMNVSLGIPGLTWVGGTNSNSNVDNSFILRVARSNFTNLGAAVSAAQTGIGTVAAHELGHQILQADHSTTGLMREGMFHSMYGGMFHPNYGDGNFFTRQQAEVIRRRCEELNRPSGG